ncbi:hypothetical protein AaE_007906 [Aphanomyces astaci]|uniref:ACB domain-containing protein n=1 Tax=Aphanomyces astaci TaxID=112090 RepID=A0A6A5A8Z0_APHAT|nr:hypothetical protein AaE_007906 [Aphanomyces astaci]
MQGASVESDFAAAVLFLQTYNGPHRILRNPTSSVRLDFDALYQQATLGSCSAIAPPLDGSSSADLNSWAKWKALGHLSKEAAMQTYIKTMDDLVHTSHNEIQLVVTVYEPSFDRSTTGGEARRSDNPAAP